MKVNETVKRLLHVIAEASDHPFGGAVSVEGGVQLKVESADRLNPRLILLSSSAEAYALGNAALSIGRWMEEREQELHARPGSGNAIEPLAGPWPR